MGFRVDYVETGEGPAILYVPGSFSTPAAWRGVQAHLPGYRHAAIALCGYGATEDPRDPAAPGLDEQIDAVAEGARRLGAPFHLVGHSFGGTVALVAVLRGAVAPLSLATFEANPFMLLADGPRATLVDETQAMSRDFEAAHLAGDPEAAGRIIDFWGGPGAWAAMPEAARAYCRATCWANVLDWRSAHALPARPTDLASVTIPVLLVRGEHANPVMRALTDVLGAALPHARTEVIAGASHFPITTHADRSAALLRAFLGGADSAD